MALPIALWVFQVLPIGRANRPVLPHILYVGKTASGVLSPLGYRIYVSLNELLHLDNKLMLCQLGVLSSLPDKNWHNIAELSKENAPQLAAGKSGENG